MARTQIDNSILKSFSSTFIGVGRNRIINGGMRIDQANGGAATASIVNAIGYSVDQFWGIGENADGVFTLQRSTSTPPTGFTHFMRATCTTADASIGATQRYYIANRLEGNNVQDFLLGTASAKQLTLSFWVRSSLTGIYSGSFRNDAGDRSYPFEYTISSANTWEQKTVTLTGDITGTWLTDTGNGFQVSWALAVGSTLSGPANVWAGASYFGTANQVNFMSSNSSRTWDITGVQLEIGSIATAFEYRPFNIELSMCQRYYEKSYALETAPATNTTAENTRSMAAQTGATTTQWNVWYRTPKRVAATVTYYNNDGTNGTWSLTSTAGVTTSRTVTGISATTYMNSAAQTASATEFYAAGHWVAAARI